MNSDTLKTFVVLSDIKNYTQTANKLFVAQSTITNRILDLENEIGFPLFIRDHKKLRLTEEGMHFLDYAKRILDLEQTAISELANLNRFSKTIKVGSTNTIYDCHLDSILLQYNKIHPDVCLNIMINHSIPLIEMLQDNIIDIAFTYVPYSKNNINCSLFATDNLILVTNNNNTKFINGIRQKDLINIPYYYCDFNFQNLGSYIKNLFPKNHPFPLIIDRSANLLPFLLNGNGYTFLPESMVKNLIDNNNLIEITPLDFSIPPISCYIQYKSENASIKEFISNFNINN